MPGVYEKNLQSLKSFQPFFKLPDRVSGFFELVKEKDEALNIKCLHKGEELYIHDKDDAAGFARQQVEPIVLRGNGLIVSFGLGLGYEAREIIKKMDRGTNFVITEPVSEVLYIALENMDLTDIFEAPNVHILFYEDKSVLLGFVQRFINQSNYKNLSAFVLKSYVSLYFTMCRDLFFVIDDLRISYELSQITQIRFTEIWQRNAIENTKYNLGSYLVSDFFDKFSGIPAILVSAGPSLKKNVELLKGREDNFLIISVDTAYKTLISHGIRPHFLISMDGQDIVYAKLEDLDYSQTPLIYVPTSNYIVTNNHRGTKIVSVVQDDFYKNELIKLEKNTHPLEMGGSVATSGFSFLQLCGANPIILIGQDLAYTGMKSHVEDTPFLKEISESDAGLIRLNSVDGGAVFSDSTLQTYLTWFQTHVASDTTGTTYIDATEGGAKIMGFHIATLKETMDKYSSAKGVNKSVEDLFEKLPLLEAAEKKQIYNNYKTAIKFIDSIKQDAINAANQLERIAVMLKKPNPNFSAVNQAYRKISYFEQKVNQNADKLQIIGIAISPFVEKLNEDFSNANFESDIEKNIFAAEGYANYYREISGRIAMFSENFRRIWS